MRFAGPGFKEGSPADAVNEPIGKNGFDCELRVSFSWMDEWTEGRIVSGIRLFCFCFYASIGLMRYGLGSDSGCMPLVFPRSKRANMTVFSLQINPATSGGELQSVSNRMPLVFPQANQRIQMFLTCRSKIPRPLAAGELQCDRVGLRSDRPQVRQTGINAKQGSDAPRFSKLRIQNDLFQAGKGEMSKAASCREAFFLNDARNHLFLQPGLLPLQC